LSREKGICAIECNDIHKLCKEKDTLTSMFCATWTLAQPQNTYRLDGSEACLQSRTSRAVRRGVHIIPDAREETVHRRGVWHVHVQAHRYDSTHASKRCTHKGVVHHFSEYREARLSLEDPECSHNCRVRQESLQEALRFVCGTGVRDRAGTRGSTCL